MITDQVVQRIIEFRREREWEQFHTLRTLSASIVLEASELLEITQWSRDSELAEVIDSRRGRIEAEIADIAILLTYLVKDLDVDLSAAIDRKLDKNAEKYPVSKSKGSSRKYDELG